jgi:hypothetical protein
MLHHTSLAIVFALEMNRIVAFTSHFFARRAVSCPVLKLSLAFLSKLG